MSKIITNLLFIVLRVGLPLLSPAIAFAADSGGGVEIAEPIEQLLKMLSGPIGASMMTLALVAAGFMFYSGRWDVMRLVATAIGSGLIFGGASLATYITGDGAAV
jgi:type IV secretory pathway VirB2 component (pilin)